MILPPGPRPPQAYDRVAECRACRRLARHLAAVRRDHPDYYCRPVPPLGGTGARALIVGLAPGMHGANRTGRPFSGDASGVFLFRSLARAGFSDSVDPAAAKLCDARITNAVRCLPPGNRPNASELQRCSGYLRVEIDQLWSPRARKPRCIVALGRLAHESVGRALGMRLAPFRHGGEQSLAPGLGLFDSFHPSRQNTNTRRLTEPMLDEVMAAARSFLDADR
ncbi:MAG: uracil-DNA glycosylase [Pseudomonadales bacterium]